MQPKCAFFFSVWTMSILLLMPTFSKAESEDNEIIIGLHHGGWPPYIIEEKDGNISGIMIDVMKEIASKQGYAVKFEPLPEKRILKAVARGNIDVHTKAKEWVDNPKTYLWTEPVVDATDVLIFPKGRPIKFETPEDLKGKNIGAVLGYGYPMLKPYFDDGSVRRNDVKDELLMLRKLLRGRDDAGIINEIQAGWLIRRNPEFKGKFAFSNKPVGKAGFRFMFTPNENWKPFIEAFNKELAAMKTDGRLYAIVQKYH